MREHIFYMRAVRAVAVTLSLLASVAQALPSVALDLTALDADAFAALDGVALEKSATVRLVQDGFAVVARTASPNVVVRVDLRREPRALLLSSHGPGGDASTEVPWGSEPLVELHLELVQKLAELTRAVAEAKTIAPPPPEAPPVGMVPLPPPPRERAWRVSLIGGGLLREGGLDPLATVSARWGVRFRVALEAGFSGFEGTNLNIRILEGQLSAGGAFAVPLPASFELEIAALVGGLLHDFVVMHKVLSEGQGTRVNVLLSLPVMLTWSASEVFAMGLRVAVGWAQAREHLDGATVIWTRGPIRFEFGFGVTVKL